MDQKKGDYSFDKFQHTKICNYHLIVILQYNTSFIYYFNNVAYVNACKKNFH